MSPFAVVAMSVLLGAASFGFGMLPLSFAFSKAPLDHVASLGSGLLLGAALGVVIPEGIETLAEAYPSTAFPTTKVAFCLLFGFTFMFVVERVMAARSSSHAALPTTLPIHLQPRDGQGRSSQSNEHEDIDAAIRDLENDLGSGFTQPEHHVENGPEQKAFPLTLGLVIHGLADGLALGATAVSAGDAGLLSLSSIVFFALAIHKAPTSFAFSISLLGLQVPRPQCRMLLAIFSAATPMGTLLCLGLLRWLGVGMNNEFSGIALLVSGGTFLYVATVLAPGAHQHSHGGQISEGKTGMALVILGIFIPFVVGSLAGHEHETLDPAQPAS